MGGIALFAFLNDRHSEIGDIIGAAVTFISAIILFGFGIYFRNKKIYIKKDGLLIKGVFKKKYLGIQSLSKVKIINRKIRIYDYSGHKITHITGLYEGYDELKKWISMNNIPIECKDSQEHKDNS